MRLPIIASTCLLIQLVDEAEIRPELDGAVRLQDIESAQQRRLTINRRLLHLYQQKVTEYFTQLLRAFVPNAILSIYAPVRCAV